jgi:hypothetical protein
MIHHFTACRVSGDKNLVFPDQKTAELDIVQFCILYLPKGIKNSPSPEELSELSDEHFDQLW